MGPKFYDKTLPEPVIVEAIDVVACRPNFCDPECSDVILEDGKRLTFMNSPQMLPNFRPETHIVVRTPLRNGFFYGSVPRDYFAQNCVVVEG
jgi:hypothetical protein